MLQMPNIDELIDVIIEEKVKIVTTGAGSPAKCIWLALKEHGVIVIPVIAAVNTQVQMEQLGADAVVAEGQRSW